VKPLKNIEGIKILQGYGGGNGNQIMSAGGSNNDERLSHPQSLSEQVTTAALNYRANAPLIESKSAKWIGSNANHYFVQQR
jgi:flotillin